jgi:multidrug efflux system membrane fusion protein
VATAQINLGFCRIVSPTDGRIGLRLVDPGNFAQVSSNTALAVITRMQPMTVVFALPEDSLPEVMTRQRAGAALQVQAYDRSGLHLLDTGTLSAVDSQINTSTGTVNLKALFPNLHEALFPNQFVNVVLRVGDLPGATAAPTSAVQRGADGTFAYLVKADNTVAVTSVKLGPTDADRVAVLTGLKPGDRVVIDGADKLRNGARVTVRGES